MSRMEWKLLIISVKIVLIFMFINLCKSQNNLDDDLELLLSIKSSFYDQFQSLSSWNSSKPFCEWQGITCFDSPHVSKIELSGKNLSGKISQSIFKFSHIQSIDLSSNQLYGEIPRNLSSCFMLRYLNLSNNNLTGKVPSASLPFLEKLDLSNNMISGEIPENIGVFSGLKFLDLGGNVLSGYIPNSITNITRLEFLTLASNQLSGEIPRKLGLMKSLRWIYLGYNGFSGEIPKEIGELSSLYHLDLVYNNLTGEIPSSLGNLTNLEYLFLYFNKLNGPIPSKLFDLTKLVSLDLSDNSLTGEISEMGFANLQNLEVLHLFSNNLSGKIPNSLTSLPNLQVLQLWSNRFSGEVPQELGKYNNLTVLDLSTNNLTGKIPEHLCSSGMLFKLILFSNSLEGEIPSSLSHCKSLQRVRIQNNRLSGELTPEFSKLPLVYFLDLSSNNFTGRIDERFWIMPQLQMLNLANNSFFGHVPGYFGSKKLETLDLTANNFSGRILRTIGEYSELMELKLSMNELSGQIPDELSFCTKLISLDLSHNHFSGEIPESLGVMPNLGQLDLSVNELTGKIPSNLGKVESLVQVNVSHNQLHGSLPSTGAFLAIDNSAVIGNVLCGSDKVTKLPSCNHFNYQTNSIFLLTLVLASLMITPIFIFMVIFVLRRKYCKPKRVESKDSAWEVQFLSSRVSRFITIKDIVSSIMEETQNKRHNFVAKKINASNISATFWTEMCKINHPNVVRLLAMCRSEKVGILVYENVEGKHLSEVIQRLGWESQLKIAVGIARALKYLHFCCSPSFIVGNMEPQSIMIDGKDEAHLRLSPPSISIHSEKRCFNSSPYVAPEIKDSIKGFTKKSDIYSFGVIMIGLLAGKSPADPELGIHETIVEWAKNCYSDCCLETWVDPTIKNDFAMIDKRDQFVEIISLALQCTAIDPIDRPCAKNVLKTLESVSGASSCVSSRILRFC